MPANALTLAAVLKDDYVLAIEDELNENIESWKDFDQRELKWEGANAIMAVRVGRNNSVGARGSTTLAPAGNQVYLRLTISAKKVYGSVQIDGPTLAAAASEKGSFAVQFATEMEGMVEDLRKKLSTYVFTGGPVIGFIWEKNAAQLNFGYNGRFDDIAVGAGEQLTFVRMDTYAVVAAEQPVSISATTLVLNANINTFGVAAGVPIAVVVTGAQALLVDPVANVTTATGIAAAVSQEPEGFITNLCSVLHFGISRAAAGPAGSATLRSNFSMTAANAGPTGAALTIEDISSLLAKIKTQSGKKPTAYWLSCVQLTSFITLLTGVTGSNLRRDIQDKPGKADPGDTSFAWANVPFKDSDVCPNGMVFFINTPSFSRATLKKGEWIASSFGDNPVQQVPGADLARADYGIYYDLVCRQPNANGVLTAVETA